MHFCSCKRNIITLPSVKYNTFPCFLFGFLSDHGSSNIQIYQMLDNVHCSHTAKRCNIKPVRYLSPYLIDSQLQRFIGSKALSTVWNSIIFLCQCCKTSVQWTHRHLHLNPRRLPSNKMIARRTLEYHPSLTDGIKVLKDLKTLH